MTSGILSCRLVFVAVCLVLLRLPTGVWADPATDFGGLDDRFESEMRSGRYQAAEQTARHMLRLAEGPLRAQRHFLAIALSRRAHAYWRQGRYSAAQDGFEEAISISRKVFGDGHPSVAADLNNLALVCTAQGRYSEAETRYKEALMIHRAVSGEEHLRVAETLDNLASLYIAMGRYAEAERHSEQALVVFRNVFREEHPDVAIALNNLGMAYCDQGRYAEAEVRYQEALRINKNVLGDEHPAVARPLGNLANLYYLQGRYAEAEPLYLQSLEIEREVLADEHHDVANTFSNLASLYRAQGQIAEATSLYRKALAVYQDMFGSEHPATAMALDHLADMRYRQGRDEEAERLYQQTLVIREKLLGPEHPDTAFSLHALAVLYRNQNRHEEAERLIERAIRIRDRAGVSPGKREASYAVRAHIRWIRGQREASLADLRHAMHFAEQVRAQASGGELQRAITFGEHIGVFEIMVACQTQLGGWAEALDAMERSRARGLLDQIRTAGIDLLAGLPEAEADRLRKDDAQATSRVAGLRKQLQVLESRRDLPPDERKRERERLEAQLHQAQVEYATVYAEIRNASPAYRLAISDDQKPVSAEKLRQWVQGRQALLLEYLLGDEGCYVFVLRASHEPQLIKLELNSEQAAALGVEAGALTAERMRAILISEDETGVLDHLRASSDPQREQKAAAGLTALWQVLVPEAERQAIIEGKYKRLVVLPDASLAQLPFEALVVQPGKEPKYLLDVGPPVVYAPSATILVNLAERNARVSRAADQPVLAVGDCVYGELAEASADTLLAQLAPQARYRSLGGQPERLKYSAWEISFVAQVFQEKGIDVASLKEDMATERNVRRNITGRRIVDLACHGRVDQQHGNLFGALAFTPGPNSEDAANDGYLTLAETYELDLAGCELAILSACDTNVGPEQRGEGVWALSRGFLAAGARRVVATNWLLDDEAAASMVSYFCSGLATAENKGEEPDYAQALNEAKRWVRSVEKWRCPYYWAPFVLLGPP